MNQLSEIEIAIRIAYFIVFLKEVPSWAPPQKASSMVKNQLPVEWEFVLEACKRREATAVFRNHGVAGAAVVAAMYLNQESQDALAKLHQ